MNRTEFEHLRDLPGKRIDGDITFSLPKGASRPWIKSLSGGTAIDGDKAAFSVVQWAEAIHSPAAWSFQLV